MELIFCIGILMFSILIVIFVYVQFSDFLFFSWLVEQLSCASFFSPPLHTSHTNRTLYTTLNSKQYLVIIKMACLFCFSKERLRNDELNGKYGYAFSKFANNTESNFDISMCQGRFWSNIFLRLIRNVTQFSQWILFPSNNSKAPCSEPLCWCTSMICFCPVQVYMRHRVLNHVNPNSGWSNYICCQGYFGGCCCIQPGNMGETLCPLPCVCLESCLCPGLAVSASSHVIRERYSLGLDEDDVRLIRCSNGLFYCSACLNIVACITDCEADDALANIVDLISDIVFCCVGGCMTAQVHHEMKMRETSSPLRQSMIRWN